MDTAEVLTIIGSVLIPMLAGFGWVIHQMNDLRNRISFLETRIVVIETILSMMGASTNRNKLNIDSDKN